MSVKVSTHSRKLGRRLEFERDRHGVVWCEGHKVGLVWKAGTRGWRSSIEGQPRRTLPTQPQKMDALLQLAVAVTP